MNSLAETICRELPSLISGDNVMVAKQNGLNRSLLNAVLRQPFGRMDMLPVIQETGWMASCPMWTHALDPRLPVRALSDLISQEDWEAHPLYTEVLIEDRMLDHLTLEMGDNPADFLTVNITRSRRGFRRAERDLLLELRPHFLQAFHNARLAQENGFCPDAADALLLLPLTSDGSPAPDAEPALRALAVRLRNRGGLPPSVQERVKEQVRELNRGERLSRLSGIPWIAHGMEHEFSLLRDWCGNRYLLAVRSATPLNPHALSPREQEILHWVSEGKRNAEIALILNIGAESVKTHLRRAFVKLGVENRNAAVRQWRHAQSTRTSA